MSIQANASELEKHGQGADGNRTSSDEELWEGPIPAHLARKRSGIKPKFIFAGLLLVGLIVTLMVYGMNTAKAYWLTVDEVHQQSSELVSQRLRVNGQVVADSEDWNAEEVTLRFSIQDEENPNQQLPIVFFGPRPDNFQRAASAIVEGELLADGTFQADTLLLKCPSRYEEEPEEIFAKATR